VPKKVVSRGRNRRSTDKKQWSSNGIISSEQTNIDEMRRGDYGNTSRRADLQALQPSEELPFLHRSERSAGRKMLQRQPIVYTWHSMWVPWLQDSRRRSAAWASLGLFGFGIGIRILSGLTTLVGHTIGLVWQMATKN